MKKRILGGHALKILFGICFAIILFWIPINEVSAANRTIISNGLGGIYIDINGSPYTNPDKNKVGNAYTNQGCTWFAAARVEERTGKNIGVHSGYNWWTSQYQNYGFTKSNTPRENSIICFSGHVAVLEKIENGVAYISEGGYLNGNDSNGYCRIYTVNVSEIASSYAKYGNTLYGYLYFEPSGSTVNVGTGFYGYIINSDQWRHLTNDGNNVSLRTMTEEPNQVWYFERLSNGDYLIKSAADNKYLEVANNSSATLANVQTGSYSNQPGQNWCIYGGSGRHVFGVRCSNCVLELKDHSTAEGANICVNTPWDTVKQYWHIWPLDGYVQASSVSLNKSSITFTASGATETLVATIAPSNTTDKDVSYSSSNTSVAKVDQNGKVTAVGSGTATITVTTQSGARTATCKVTVNLKPDANGWYCATALPSNVTSDKYEIQYQNIYEKYSVNSPGTGWQDTGIDKRVETKDGAMYELGYPIATSETVRLEGYYYYHWCGASAGQNNVNYGPTDDKYVHLDRVSADRAWEYASYTDPEDNRYTYYYLKWNDNSDAYCLGNSTCDEAHAGRSYYWYKSYMYQNYKIENLNLYKKTSAWSTSKDSSATSVNIRYRLKPTSVSLNKTTATLTSKGATVALTATVLPTDAGCKDVTWKSDDTNVATVNSNGVVTAVGNGNATITATTVSGGKTATCKVTVSIAPTSVTLDKTSATLTEGESLTLKATVSPSNAANKNVTWASSDKSVATVDANGKVTAVGSGTATITVTTVVGGKTAKCTIVVEAKVTAGWQKNDNGWWYRNSDGTYPKDCWKVISDKWYVFDSRGYMREGWYRNNEIWYYLQPNSGHMVSGWQYINNKLYYFTPGGVMATGWQYIDDTFYYFTSGGALAKGWQYIDNTFYYFTSAGEMATGWQSIDGEWYYFKASGEMVTGWMKQNDTWYYLKPTGEMATGWVKVGSTWYYMEANGAMATGWINLNGTWYYLYDNGAMAADTWIGDCYVNSSGAWVR